MTPYYFGGYYLIKERPIDFGSLKSKTVLTCSNCINDSLVENWSYTWATNKNDQIESIKQDYRLTDEIIPSIRRWVDESFNNKRIGWINTFNDLQTAKDYKSNFFSHLLDTRIIGIYFSDREMETLLTEFKPQGENLGTIGLYDNLSKRIPEENSSAETLIGHDIIGIEVDGGFHTFYCHDISKELTAKFDLTINKFGLFDDAENWQNILDYMNDERNGFSPVPWFVCKTKLVTE